MEFEVTKAPPMLPPTSLERLMKKTRSIVKDKVGDIVWISPEEAEMLYDILVRVCIECGYKLPE